MYTDNHYEYPHSDAQSVTPPESPDAGKKRKGLSRGLLALSLALALIGGTFGGAASGYYFGQKSAAGASGSAAASVSASTPKYATPLASTTTNSINSIYETYKTAVVGIRNDGTSTNAFGQTTPFAASGTGFIISPDGYILTNNHVVDGAKKVTVTLFDEKSYTASIIGTAPDNDIALLKIDAAGLTAVKLGNSDNLIVGEPIFAIGNPLGELTYTVTAGIVSAENRDFDEDGTPINMFQTDAAINPGNSGGPIFNMNGEVVGISTAKYSSTGIEGIGFAIPINDAASVATQLKETGHVNGRPYLGISAADAGSQSGSTGGVSGVYVAAVDPNGGSAKAGVQKGDIITALGDKSIKSTTDLVTALKALHAGDTVKVTINRDGRTLTLSVTLDQNKPSI
jgi:serine protease Do